MTDFVIQVGGTLPPHALDKDGSVQRHTVLLVTVRDQAALYGFLEVLNDLGLDLLDFHQVTGTRRAGSVVKHTDPLTIEVLIRGSIGHLAAAELRDHAEVTHLATRLVLTDRRVLDEVLDWARQADAPIEYVGEPPPTTGASVTPPSARGVTREG